jgi:hypothetical protein
MSFLLLSQALLMSKLSSKLSKTTTLRAFSDQIFLHQAFDLARLLTEILSLILPVLGSGQYHS